MMGLMLGASSLFAQPGSVQKAAKSVFTLTTFNKDGNIISSTQGVFIDNKGTAIGTFKPFIGAVKATIVDASGKSMDVDAILGADELYDVAKFRVLGNTTAANIATAESPAGSKVWLVPYSIKNLSIGKMIFVYSLSKKLPIASISGDIDSNRFLIELSNG